MPSLHYSALGGNGGSQGQAVGSVGAEDRSRGQGPGGSAASGSSNHATQQSAFARVFANITEHDSRVKVKQEEMHGQSGSVAEQPAYRQWSGATKSCSRFRVAARFLATPWLEQAALSGFLHFLVGRNGYLHAPVGCFARGRAVVGHGLAAAVAGSR